MLAGLLMGCDKSHPPGAPPSLPAVSLQTQRIEAKSRVATEEVVGTVRAKLRSVIEAKVSGKIEKLLVAPGQKVRQGELLARIEAREVQARLDQALAVRQQAESDLKRAALLLDQKILAQSEYDSAQSKFRVADATVTERRNHVGYTQVTAPFDGVITRKLSDRGDLAVPGKALLEMEDSTTLRLEADVPEAVMGKLNLGDKLPVRMAALQAELDGVISEISPAADPNSRTFLVKLDLPATTGLRAGQFGRVAMPIGETSAVRVPASAVIQRGQMELVFIVNDSDSKARLRIVKAGKRLGSEVELVSGVSAGERIVVERVFELKDGQPVK
jgi:RND family efflux transporter MFP subunit